VWEDHKNKTCTHNQHKQPHKAIPSQLCKAAATVFDDPRTKNTASPRAKSKDTVIQEGILYSGLSQEDRTIWYDEFGSSDGNTDHETTTD